MAQSVNLSNRADQIFRIGPETLVAETPVIVSGPIVNYSKQVLSQSQPDGVPLKWVVKGEIKELQSLKGTGIASPLNFTRAEQSVILIKDETTLYWEDAYGELQPGGQAVLFIGGEDKKTVLKVIPSGSGEQNLSVLVKDIAEIQRLESVTDQIEKWLQYLRVSRSDEGKKAALRSLVNGQIKWEKLSPELNRLLTDPENSPDVRVFGFGIVSFGVYEEKWSLGDRQQAADFLCRVFSAENNSRLAMQYIQHLKLILRYSDEESFRKAREPLRQQILNCLKERRAAGNLDPQLEAQFREIFQTYPEE